MKKTLSLILALALALTLCACGGGEAQTDGDEKPQVRQGLQIGYHKIDITPEENVPLSGSATRGTSSGMLDYLYGTCLAISNGENDTALIFGIDIQNAYAPTPSWRSAISKATGVPEERIMLCFTHTHSAPNTGSNDPSISRYNKMVSERLSKAGQEAIADLAVAQAFTATTKVENMNFVRRYIMKDGSLCGDNFGSTASGYDHHETEADNTLQLVKFTRENKDDVILANFQMHSNYTIHQTSISSDVAGAFRDALETASGAKILYLNGASGNINPKSRIENENKVTSHKEWGQKMAQYAMAAAANFAPVEVTKLKTSQKILYVNTNHADDALVPKAQTIVDYWNSTSDTATVNAMLKEAGISSIYHAQNILANASRGLETKMEIDAYAIGDIAFIFAPVEMFDTNGMYIKKESPFSMTFICCYANQCQGYMPSALGYENSGYEVVTSMFAAGTAETVAEEYLTILNSLKG